MQLARRVRTIATLSGALFLGSLALVPAALAGEIKFGEGLDSLATDDNGKLTDEGKATVLTELDSIPGEDAWDMNLWARLDSGAAEGPLYIEFWQRIDTDLDGKPDQDSLAYRHEDRNFDGSRYYLKNVVLEENFGFNKDRTYKVKIVQVSSSGRDIKLAEGKLRLIDTGREPEAAGDGGDADAVSEQDAMDSFAEGEDENTDAPAPETTPPAVEETPASKRGCSIGSPSEHPLSLGLIVLLAQRLRMAIRAGEFESVASRDFLAHKTRVAAECVWRRGLTKKGPGLCHGASGNGYALLVAARALMPVDPVAGRLLEARAKRFALWVSEHATELATELADAPGSLFEGLAGAVAFVADAADASDAWFPGSES